MLKELFKSLFIFAGPFAVTRAIQRKRLGAGISILYGHRVLSDQIIADKQDPRTITGQTSVSEVLAAIKELKKFYKIISMDDALKQLQSGKVEQESVVLTFDDGFQDNFSNLYPLLKKYNVPATYYINASVLSSKNSLWFQSVINYFYAVQESSVFVELTKREYDLSTAAKRYQAAFEFMRYLQANHKPQEFHSIIEEVAGELRLPGPEDLHMTWQELKQLADDPLITIGAHSYNHYPLGYCDEELSNFEITQSIKQLENKLAIKIQHFSYPRGHVEDFNQHHINCIKNNKVQSGVSTIRGVNRVGDDLYSLKRVGFPQNISQAKADFLWHVGGIPQLIQTLKGSR